MKEDYVRAEIKGTEFKEEDVIATSGERRYRLREYEIDITR